jgi:hypothetical protein
MIDPVDIGDDDPVSLAVAAKVFLHGQLTKSSLRTEAAKGNLEILRIANKDFVTRNGVKRMLELCRVKRNPPTSGSDQTQDTGSSRMMANVSPRDALRAMLQEQKKASARTSPKNTRQSAEVLRLRSPLAKS